MKTWNRLSLVGRVAAAPEARETKTGKTFVRFPVATHRMAMKKNGEKEEVTDYHRVTAWEGLAKVCKDSLAIGQLIYLEGPVHHGKYLSKEGETKFTLDVILDRVTFLSAKKDAAKEENGQSDGKGFVARAKKVLQKAAA